MFSKLGTRSLQSEHTTTCSTATKPACSDVRPGPRPRHQSQPALSFLSSDWSRGEEAERGESRWSLCWTTGEDSHLLHGHFLSCSLSVQQYLQHVAVLPSTASPYKFHTVLQIFSLRSIQLSKQLSSTRTK